MKNIFPKPNRDTRPLFILGTGRCGTHLMYELFNTMKKVDAHHIIHLDGDSFHRYAKWNNIDIDLGDFINFRQEKIEASQKKSSIYVESNPYLSFHVEELQKYFRARFIFIIRNPEDVVNSHVKKGWYESDPVYFDNDKPLGFQYEMKTNHFFGRIIPTGKDHERWKDLSRIGKLSWMWEKVNIQIHQQLKQLPEEDRFFLKVEELDYSKFRNILQHFSIGNPPSKKDFELIINRKPGRSSADKEVLAWSKAEHSEFEKETTHARSLFGY